jgi:hypothetical protein
MGSTLPFVCIGLGILGLGLLAVGFFLHNLSYSQCRYIPSGEYLVREYSNGMVEIIKGPVKECKCYW